jgi:hypothetical protein
MLTALKRLPDVYWPVSAGCATTGNLRAERIDDAKQLASFGEMHAAVAAVRIARLDALRTRG